MKITHQPGAPPQWHRVRCLKHSLENYCFHRQYLLSLVGSHKKDHTIHTLVYETFFDQYNGFGIQLHCCVVLAFFTTEYWFFECITVCLGIFLLWAPGPLVLLLFFVLSSIYSYLWESWIHKEFHLAMLKAYIFSLHKKINSALFEFYFCNQMTGQVFI